MSPPSKKTKYAETDSFTLANIINKLDYYHQETNNKINCIQEDVKNIQSK